MHLPAEILDKGRLIMTYDPPLDKGIVSAVMTLAGGDVETFESCEGGPGHAYPEPTVRFHGGDAEGYRALSVALSAGLPVDEVRRSWRNDDGILVGPWWEMTLRAIGPRD